jgi:ClpP class serine protease
MNPASKISETPSVANQEDQEITVKQLMDQLFSGFGSTGTDADRTKAKEMIRKYINQKLSKNPIYQKYNIIVLFDSSIMVKSDADSIYRAVTGFTEKKPLLLILYSSGGSISSAYLIGKLCREYSSQTFSITVPRHAKSAATLLCCAADEIHMGSMSELGPIDPQINDLPALGLKNSIEHIAKLVKDTPESAEMFAKYLHYSLKPIDIGYYERVAESALQYAQKLLETHADKLPEKAERIAYDLVYTYKDHGFVIDKAETLLLFGDKVVKHNSDEYSLGNEVYQELSLVESIANYLGYNFYYIGSLDSDPTFTKRR